MNPGIKYRNPATAFMLFLVLFFIGISELVGSIIYFSGISNEVFNSLWFLIIMQVVRLILPLTIWLAITKGSFKRHMPSQPMGVMNWVYVLFFTLLVIPVMMFISGITSQFVDNDVAELLSGFANTGHPWWLMMLAIAVTPSIVEEVVFRGYIQSASRGKIAKIAVLNGFLFGIMHFNLHQFAYTFILGVVFAYILYFTRNIWAAIFSHFIINGSQVSFMHWVMQSYDYAAEAADISLAQAMYNSLADTDPYMAQRMYDLFYGINEELFAVAVIGVIAIGTTIGAVFLFRAFVAHNRKRNAEFDIQNASPEPETDEVPEVEREELPLHSRIDWCLVSVVGIYIVITIILPRMV